MKKNKRSKSEQEAIGRNLRSIMSKEEKAMPFNSGAIVNGNQQPIIISSSEDFEKHIINLGPGLNFTVPTKMIPYLSLALKILYMKNTTEFFEGDKKKCEDHNNKILEELEDMSFFDLSGCSNPECENCNGDGSCDSGLGDMPPEFQESLEAFENVNSDEAFEVIKELPDDKIEIVVENLNATKEIAEEYLEKVEEGKLTPEQQKELAIQSNEQMLEHLKEVEKQLMGTRADKNRVIDFPYIKGIFEKHGAKAAEEEIMRLPHEQRDELLQQMLALFTKK